MHKTEKGEVMKPEEEIDAVKMLILRYTGRIDMSAKEADNMSIYEELKKILFPPIKPQE